MSPRPRTINDEAILSAARAVFLERGIHGTTAEVARRAKVSQASVFKRFKSKHELFVAAMQGQPDRQNWLGQLSARTEEVGLKEALAETGVRAIGFVSKVLPLAVVSWSNRGEVRLPKAMAARHSGPMKAAAVLVKLFEAEMREGRLRKQDPWLLTRAFMASIQGYALMSVVFNQALGPKYEPEAYIRGILDLLWEGARPR